jgi:glycosyltransferase involved in cell wall biosynthesis
VHGDGYYLIVSALVPYKRIDLAVKAFNDTSRELLIVGNGPELGNLRAMACANVTFVENAGDDEVVEYMKKCSALIFPGEEDFGIVPLEAQACGKPIIALGKGGALETVIGLDDSQSSRTNATGIFFNEQKPEALLNAVHIFEEKKHQFNANKCRDNTLRFDRSAYKEKMGNFIEHVLNISN